MSTRTYGPRTPRLAAPRTNRYGGKCTLCGNWVGEGAGVALQSAPGGKWVVQHNAGACPAPAAPKAPMATPEVGYYVRGDGALVKVQESKRRNDDGTPRRYGLIFTRHGEGERPTWDYVRGAGLSVADLRPMTAHDAALMGLASGHCINCCAPLGPKDPAKPTLSSLVAARIGYGEVCAASNGWPFPKGAAAQRDYLNTTP